MCASYWLDKFDFAEQRKHFHLRLLPEQHSGNLGRYAWGSCMGWWMQITMACWVAVLSDLLKYICIAQCLHMGDIAGVGMYARFSSDMHRDLPACSTLVCKQYELQRSKSTFVFKEKVVWGGCVGWFAWKPKLSPLAWCTVRTSGKHSIDAASLNAACIGGVWWALYSACWIK